MSQGTRSAITLSGLGLLLVVAAVWGWSAATEPLPGKVDSPLCVTTDVPAGTKVFPEDVTVSVYNGGTREGLAGRTMQLLSERGFARGTSGNVNAGRPVRVAQVWTRDPANPAVRLVAGRLGPRTEIVRRNGPGVGVVVVVGDAFRNLVKAPRSILAKKDTEICSPPVG